MYPPISLGKNILLTYVESQPSHIGDKNYLPSLSIMKVKVSDLGVGYKSSIAKLRLVLLTKVFSLR